MKKLFLAATAILLIFACKNEPKDYMEISGDISNWKALTDTVKIMSQDGYLKNILIDKDGKFNDTLKVTEGKYIFKIGDEYGQIYLKNDESLNIKTDYDNFDKDLTFTGKGKSVEISTAVLAIRNMITANMPEDLLSETEENLHLAVEKTQKDYQDMKSKYPNVDSTLWNEMDMEIEQNMKGIVKYYSESKARIEEFKGKQSPTFAMEDINGDIVKLEDFRGKYVYIDVWATWCGPCKVQIPHLKELEEEYNGKDIVFVSMSIDPVKDKEKWKNFVKEKDLKGVQIFAENDWQSEFVQSYKIKGIPNFILIDKEGKIISPSAPLPSSKKIKEIFESLDI